MFKFPVTAARPVRMQEEAEVYRCRVLFLLLLLLGFFFSLWDPLPNCGSLLPWWREAGREDAKLRPAGLTLAMLNSEGGAITRRKWKDSTNDTVAFERGGGGVVWGALDYDSQLYNLERPGDGSTTALAFWHLWEAVPSFTSRHCCALRSLRSLTSMSSTSLKTTMKKNNKKNEIVASLRCALNKSSPESSTFHSASKGSQRGQV